MSLSKPSAPHRDEIATRIAQLEKALQELEGQRCDLQAELEQARAALARVAAVPPTNPTSKGSASNPKLTPEEKVALFRRVFRGREDVYPVRFVSKKTGKSGYSPECSNKFVDGLCDLRTTKCSECRNRAYRPLDNEAVLGHLQGRHVIGVYPMLLDETCWFLAVDFDGEAWQDDVAAVREACARLRIPAYVERSRSGDGAHVWFFFSVPVAASLARKLGSHIITEAMSARPGLPFKSYDRLFPNQDTMPAGGLGNLIALPLQFEPRQRGNSVFIDEDGNKVPSQWGLLAGIQRIDPAKLEIIVRRASHDGTVLGVRSVGWQHFRIQSSTRSRRCVCRPGTLRVSSAARRTWPSTSHCREAVSRTCIRLPTGIESSWP